MIDWRGARAAQSTLISKQRLPPAIHSEMGSIFNFSVALARENNSCAYLRGESLHISLALPLNCNFNERNRTKAREKTNSVRSKASPTFARRLFTRDRALEQGIANAPRLLPRAVRIRCICLTSKAD